MNGRARQGLAAPYALVTGYAALLAIGTVAAALHGRFSATGVLIASAAVVTAWSFAAEPLAVIPLGIVGWLTAVGFAHPPYAQLRLTGPHAANAAIVIGACALAGAALGLLMRWLANRPILESVGAGGDAARPGPGPGPAGDGREQLAGGWPAADRRGPDGEGGLRRRRPPGAAGRPARRGRPAPADRPAGRGPAGPEPDRRPADLPGRRGRARGDRRLLAGRARRRLRQPAAQLVLHPAAAHVHHRQAGQPAGAAAVRHRRRGGQQRRSPRGQPGRPGGPQPRGSQAAAGAGADRPRRRRHPGGGAGSSRADPGGPRGAAGKRQRPLGPDRGQRQRRRPGPPSPASACAATWRSR